MTVVASDEAFLVNSQSVNEGKRVFARLEAERKAEAKLRARVNDEQQRHDVDDPDPRVRCDVVVGTKRLALDEDTRQVVLPEGPSAAFNVQSFLVTARLSAIIECRSGP